MSKRKQDAPEFKAKVALEVSCSPLGPHSQRESAGWVLVFGFPIWRKRAGRGAPMLLKRSARLLRGLADRHEPQASDYSRGAPFARRSSQSRRSASTRGISAASSDL